MTDHEVYVELVEVAEVLHQRLEAMVLHAHLRVKHTQGETVFHHKQVEVNNCTVKGYILSQSQGVKDTQG